MIDEIEGQICIAIRSVLIESLCGDGDGEWTKAIFKSVSDLGVKLNFQICSSKNDGEHDGGWLFDLIWYENDTQGRLKRLPLVLESEWSRSFAKIKYDFEKLLVVRARYKVMIFQAKGRKMLDYFKRLQSSIEAFHIASEEESYLLVCFDEDQWTFQIKTIKVEKSIHITKVIEVTAQAIEDLRHLQ